MNNESQYAQVRVPMWALQYVLAHASFWDEGPPDEGWSSQKMQQARDALSNAITEGETK